MMHLNTKQWIQTMRAKLNKAEDQSDLECIETLEEVRDIVNRLLLLEDINKGRRREDIEHFVDSLREQWM